MDAFNILIEFIVRELVEHVLEDERNVVMKSIWVAYLDVELQLIWMFVLDVLFELLDFELVNQVNQFVW